MDSNLLGVESRAADVQNLFSCHRRSSLQFCGIKKALTDKSVGLKEDSYLIGFARILNVKSSPQYP